MHLMDLKDIEGVSGGINLEQPPSQYPQQQEMSWLEWEMWKERLGLK